MTGVIRLQGEDSDVIAVAQAAAKTIAADRDVRRSLFLQLWNLHSGRRQLAAPGVSVEGAAPISSPASESSRAWQGTWGALLGIGLTAAMTAAVMFGPAGRRNTYISAELAFAVATPAAIIAAVLLVALLLLPVPRGQAARYGTVCTVIVAIVVAVMLAFRIFAGESDSRGFTLEQVALWTPVTSAIFLLLLLVSLRFDVIRRRTAEVDDRPGARELSRVRVSRTRDLRRTAERLARGEQGRAAEGSADWLSRLDRLEARGVDARTIAQARTLTPTAWLTWVFYDGDIDVSEILPTS
ncbi:hypothetical protein GCM10027416_32460 [Okibacterium endophyticum]